MKNTSTVVKQFVVDYTTETFEPLMEHEVNGLDYKYVYGNDRLSVDIWSVHNSGSIVENGDHIRLYYHMDYLGTADYLTSPVSGRVESWTHYNEWGEITHNAVVNCGQRTLDLVKRYATHDYDAVLDLYYAKARMYDAANRRFLAVDPILEPSGYDLREYVRKQMQFMQYMYANNNPLVYVDLLGLVAILGNTYIETVTFGDSTDEYALESDLLYVYMEMILKSNKLGNGFSHLNNFNRVHIPHQNNSNPYINKLEDRIVYDNGKRYVDVRYFHKVMCDMGYRIRLQFKSTAEINAENLMTNLSHHSSTLKISQIQKQTITNIGKQLLLEGYEAAFVAGMLANIVAEGGTAGMFESSAYKENTKPEYLVYMDELYNYRAEYSGKNIKDVGLEKTYELLKKLEADNWKKGKMGIGIAQWTAERALVLVELYIEVLGTKTKPSYDDIARVEGMMISRELSSERSFQGIYPNWLENNQNQLNTREAAYSAGYDICMYYEKPRNREESARVRGENAMEIYDAMMNP